MINKTFFLAAFTALCASIFSISCTNDISDVVTGQISDPTHGAEMIISKVGTSDVTDVTRATATEVSSWATAPEKNIGVSVYSSVAGTEAMKTGSVNMKWTYNTESSAWDAQNPFYLFSWDEGFVTAYYPYGESVNPTAIDIDGTKDYMYALIGDNKTVNYSSPQTSLLMHHANAQLRVNLIRKGYAGTGTISSFSVKGSKFASAGKLNSLTGVVSNYTMTPELTGINEGTLAVDISATPTAKIEALYTWFVPVSDAAAPVTFDATIDGLNLRYTTLQQFLAGKRYTFNLYISETGEITLAENTPIDLDLPSGLKWAAGNLGAEEETDSGLYFAWGETEGHERNSGYEFTYENYNAKGLNAISANLNLSQDAANVRLGGDWRMPTNEDYLEICVNCFAEWTENYEGSGKAGVIFYSTASNTTGKGYYKGASTWVQVKSTEYGPEYTDATQPDDFMEYTLATPHIFIPAAGLCDDIYLNGTGEAGTYWTSTYIFHNEEESTNMVYYSIFTQDFNFLDSNYPWFGLPVRGVCK